jgi:inward rectifier potassium channel
MASRKINPSLKSNNDTGFGTQASQIGGRFVNKDGTFNLRKEGAPIFKRVSVYSFLLTITWLRFMLLIVGFFLLVNIIFTSLYLLMGESEIQGLIAPTTWGRVKEVFFFSVQTFTTVGYGRINPVGDGAHIISSLELLTGLLSVAVVTGLLYGRFIRPKAYIDFSEEALVSPYKNGRGLMFRMVPYKINHHITNAQITVTTALMDNSMEKPEFKFYSLKLERSRIDTFNMNWTVVHPIDEESPFFNFTREDLQKSELEIYVLITGFDQIFSNTVMHRTSYTFEEIVWGAKFKPMYRELGETTVVELNKLNDYERIDLGDNVLADAFTSVESSTTMPPAQ